MGRALGIVILGIAAAGCAWAPVQPGEERGAGTNWSSWGTGDGDGGGAGVELDGQDALQRPAVQAVEYATGLIGTPYQWGGATPAGFDCSGLVYYTFHKAGLSVPRTSQAQYRAATPVPIDRAQPGDLVFFGQRGRISHVGIYLGDQQFVHAPDAGRYVTIGSLAEGYYRARFAGAGRFN